MRKPNKANCRQQGNWLFAGSARAGRRQAAVMSLIQSAKLNGHDPYVYLKDVLNDFPHNRLAVSKSCYRMYGNERLENLLVRPQPFLPAC